MNNIYYPLTDAQLGIYLACMKDPGTMEYNLTTSLFFEKSLRVDPERLKAAVQKVVDHYPIMSSHIRAVSGVPSIVPSEESEVIIEDLFSKEADPEQLYDRFIQPIDLEKDPLFKFALVHTPSGLYLLEEMHHIIWDGTGIQLFNDNLIRAYKGLELIAEEKTGFDLCLEEQGRKETKAYQESRDFYDKMLAGVETDSAILPDEIEAPDTLQNGKQKLFSLSDYMNPEEIPYRIKSLGLSNSTIFMGAFAYALAKMTNQSQSVFCMIEGGRHSEDVQNTFTMMVKTLPLCININEDERISDYLADVQTLLKDLLKHDCCSIVELAPEYEVSSDILFVYQGGLVQSTKMDDFVLPIHKHREKDSATKLSLDVFRTENDYLLSFEYRGDLYLDETIESFAGLYIRILQGFLHSEYLKDVSFVNDKVRTFYQAVNENTVDFDRSLTVVDLFRQQAKKYPERDAILYKDRVISYQELDAISERLAKYLTGLGVKEEEPVGIMVNRSERFPICALGVLKAGAACQPLDFHYPQERLLYMLEDSGAKIVLADSELKEIIRDFQGTVIEAETIESLTPDQNIVLNSPKADSLFTLIYTSGTTGKPKGCMLEHRNLVNFCLSFCRKFHVTEKDHAAAYGAFGFDASMQDLYPYLTCGASVAIIPEEIRLDLPALNEFVLKYQITMMDCTTQLGRQFVTTYPENPYMRVFTVGGEKLVPCEPPEYRFVNTYGPTECTIYVTDYEVDKIYDSVPIGKPFGNCDAYILDKQNRLLPPGAVGELVISGYPVIRGYLNRPDKNEECFLQNTVFPREGYERMYLTGDVCRYLTDGNLQFVGRKDDQVKIRGFRIELTEIERRIREYPEIKDAVVVARDLPAGGKAVVAYIVSEEEVSVEKLHAFIAETLPEYMVPMVTMQIEKIPLNPNGKVDKRKLPEPVFQKKEKTEKPLNELERELSDMIIEITGIPEFDFTDSLVSSGLTSLSTIMFSAKLFQRYGIRLPVTDLMEDDCSLISVEDKILRFLLDKKPAEAPEKEQEEAEQKLTEMKLCAEQLGVYYDSMKRPAELIYNIPMMYRFARGTDAGSLKRAVEKAIAAHPVLAVKIILSEGELIQKQIEDLAVDVAVKKMDAGALVDYAQSFVRPFALDEGPLYHAEIIDTGESVVLLFDVHHIIFDGLSLSVFLRDIVSAYETGLAPKKESAYYRFIREQERFEVSSEKEKAVEYYDKLFENFEEATDIAPDLSGIPQAGKLKESRTAVKKEMTDHFCKQMQITPAALFLAALQYTVCRCNASNDIYLSMISSGRENIEYAESIGMFVKTLPLHGRIPGESSVLEYLKEVSGSMHAAVENSIYPAMKLFDRYPFSSRINYACQIGVDEKIRLTGQEITETMIMQPLPKFHISVHIDEADSDYIVNVQYNDALYSDSYMDTFSSAIASCAVNLMKGPDAKVAKVSLLDDKEQARIKRFTNIVCRTLSCHLFHRLFELQAEKKPDTAALIACDGSFSYKELNALMNRIANALIKCGVIPGDRVAVLLPRTSALMVSMYAVMKAGAAYIPCDPEYPEERIRYIIENSEARFIITDKPRGFANELLVGDLLSDGNENSPDIRVSPEDTAYIIYTSGSTGKPKGVVIRHQGIANYLAPYPENRHVYAAVEKGSVMVSVTTASFDMSLKETAVALCNGLTLVLANEEETQDPSKLAELFERTGGDIFNATPSRMEQYMMLPRFCEALSKCKVIMCGGEKYSPKLLKRLQEISGATIFNTYGPTEITVSCNAKDLTNEERVCVGAPLLNVNEYIVDSDGNLLPTFFTGELLVGGPGVAKGYFNNPEMTKKSFFEYSGEWIYKTGDYAKWTPEGDVVILGRTDNQVKLRGLRIELGEVERVILSCPGVIQAVVLIKKIRGTEHLSAYYVDDGTVTEDALKAFISKSLTKYMVPTAYLRMEKMPQTPNGKTDIKALPDPELIHSEDYVEPATEAEALICNLFGKILQLDKVSAVDSFFDLGGTSLSATSLLVLLNENGFEISYGDIFAHKTPRALAAMTGGGGDFIDNLSSYNYSVFDEILKENRLENLNGPGTPLGNVLITGAVGFLGVHILQRFLEDYDGKAYCLVRDGRLPAEKRLEVQLFYYFEKDYSELFGERIFVIKGDVTGDDWFPEVEKEKIDTVINCAALVKHFSQTDDIERTNVGGVLHLIEFCKQHQCKLIQISTGSVAGDRVNDHPSPEIRLTEQSLYYGQLIDNQYVHSKFMGERYVLEAIRDGLKAKIMRVGNLSARKSDGEFQMNSSTNGFMGRLKAYLAIGAFPYSSMDYPVEMAPIDETAEAILKLSETADACCIFHPFNNHYVPLGDVIMQMKKMGFEIELAEDSEFHEKLQAAEDDPKLAPILTTLIAYDNKDSGRKVEMIGVDNEYTSQALYRRSFCWSMTSRQYMNQFLNALFTLGFFTLD